MFHYTYTHISSYQCQLSTNVCIITLQNVMKYSHVNHISFNIGYRPLQFLHMKCFLNCLHALLQHLYHRYTSLTLYNDGLLSPT